MHSMILQKMSYHIFKTWLALKKFLHLKWREDFDSFATSLTTVYSLIIKILCYCRLYFSPSTRILGLIGNVPFTFSTLDCLNLLILYISIVRPKLEYASAVWKSITSTNSKQLECIQKKFVKFWYYRLISTDYNDRSYADTLHTLNLRPLHEKRRQLHANFAMHVFLGFKSYPSSMDFNFQVFKFPLGTSDRLSFVSC